MKILIDADGCPVVDLAVNSAKRENIPCIILCDTSHEIYREGAETVTVSKGADSADFALVSRTTKGDIVVTQDYGLAAMCLSKGARVVNQDGMEYTDDNIEGLLLQRHTSKKIIESGGRLKTIPKRTNVQNITFAKEFLRIIQENQE